MLNTQTINKTNQVVREATRVAARDVRAPKVVRQGKVERTIKTTLRK